MKSKFYFDMNIIPKKEFSTYVPMYNYEDYNPQKFNSTIVINDIEYIVNSQVICIKNGGQYEVSESYLETFNNDIIDMIKNIEGMFIFNQTIESPPLKILEEDNLDRKSIPYLSYINTRLIELHNKTSHDTNVAKLLVEKLDQQVETFELGELYFNNFLERKIKLIGESF